MQHTNFEQARRLLADFVDTNLFMSTFWRANAKGAHFREVGMRMVNFTLANLHRTEFWETSITDEQLKSAHSIRAARLINGTLARDRNLIKNGYADCNSPLSDSWLLQTGRVISAMSSEDSSNCQFTLQSVGIGAIM